MSGTFTLPLICIFKMFDLITRNSFAYNKTRLLAFPIRAKFREMFLSDKSTIAKTIGKETCVVLIGNKFDSYLKGKRNRAPALWESKAINDRFGEISEFFVFKRKFNFAQFLFVFEKHFVFSLKNVAIVSKKKFILIEIHVMRISKENPRSELRVML